LTYPSLPVKKGMAFGALSRTRQAEVVANIISVQIIGKGKADEWDGHGACFLEVGGGQCVHANSSGTEGIQLSEITGKDLQSIALPGQP
jgi:hypothetical protein